MALMCRACESERCSGAIRRLEAIPADLQLKIYIINLDSCFALWWSFWPNVQDSYLVDPASSHMLVSKIKPCMSKYKQFIQ